MLFRGGYPTRPGLGLFGRANHIYFSWLWLSLKATVYDMVSWILGSRNRNGLQRSSRMLLFYDGLHASLEGFGNFASIIFYYSWFG